MRSGTAAMARPAATLPMPRTACTRPAVPAWPAAVASTVVPVWTEPKTTPMSSWAVRRMVKVGVSSRPAAAPVWRAAWARRAVGCRAKAHAEDHEESGGREQPGPRRGEGDEGAEEGRPEDERSLVSGSLVGEGGLDEPGLVDAAVPGDGPPPHSGERPDLRGEGAGRPGGGDQRGGVGTRRGQGDQRDERQAADQRLHEDDGALADTVSQGAGDRRADGVGHGERPRGQAAGGIRARGGGDQQQGAHLAHGQGEPAEEGGDDVEGAGEGEEAPVGGDGRHGFSFCAVPGYGKAGVRRTRLRDAQEP